MDNTIYHAWVKKQFSTVHHEISDAELARKIASNYIGTEGQQYMYISAVTISRNPLREEFPLIENCYYLGPVKPVR